MKSAIVILALLSFVLALSIPVNAASIHYFFVVPERAPPGGWFMVMAGLSDWSGGSCSIILDNTILGEVEPVYYQDTGWWEITEMFQVPRDASIGSHIVTLQCGSAKEQAHLDVAKPSIQVSPVNASVGDTVQVTVAGLENMTQLFVLTLDSTPLIVFEPNPESNTATFTFTLPPLTNGNHMFNLYVTVDQWMNLATAVETGAPSGYWPVVHGYFPERLVLVASASFRVANGVPTASQVNDSLAAINGSVARVEAMASKNEEAIANLSSSLESLKGQLNSQIAGLSGTVKTVNTTLNGNIKNLQGKIKALQDENAQLKQHVLSLEAHSKKLEEKAKTATNLAYVAILLGIIGIIMGAIGMRKH